MQSMFQKIKDLIKVREMVDEITAAVKKQKEELDLLKIKVSSFDITLKEISSNFEKFRNEQQEYLQQLKDDTGKISDARKEFIDEINDFKLKKTHMQREMIERADNEVNDSLSRLKTDVLKYNELKRDLEAISNTISVLKTEINKFTTISSHIKATDFETSKFAKRIFDADQEKLKLMKDIDTLKHLIGRERKMRH